jgi:hypothetical protein
MRGECCICLVRIFEGIEAHTRSTVFDVQEVDGSSVFVEKIVIPVDQPLLIGSRSVAESIVPYQTFRILPKVLARLDERITRIHDKKAVSGRTRI